VHGCREPPVAVLNSTLPSDLSDQVARALREDIGSGDITAALISARSQARARVLCREPAVLCGAPWFNETFRQLDPAVEIRWRFHDGASVAADTILCDLHGPARAILTGERTALNFLQLLSATASITHRYVEAVTGTSCRILDTRKTIPGLRSAQKYAVRCGGGANHRLGLYDMVLIKENHIAAAGSIAAAVAAGGGVVVLGTGTWDVVPGMIELPAGVQLRGRGAEVTRVLRHEGSDASVDRPVVTLLGKNEVRDIRFVTEHKFAAQDRPRPILQLGSTYLTDSRSTSSAAIVKDVVISNNIFDKSYGAIVDGGAPIERLFVTSNRFGDFHLALQLGGNRFNVGRRFGIADSIIAYNTFVPGSYIDSGQKQGVYASELGASSRVDFSDNDADGADRGFLNSPDDPPGWRAAFFFHMNDNQEMLLISHNTASCTGDKAGDGEAVALDNNANTFALAAASPVLAATEDTVRIREPLNSVQNDRPIDVGSYYVGHWVQIAQGTGMGQTRKIVSYRIDSKTLETTFVVSPAWDVPPQAAVSIITIGREFWQVYIVGNTIDQRKPLCTKGNVTGPKGGAISIWAQSSDSVVEGNRQFDTDGIVFQQAYGADERDCEVCRVGITTLQSFLEIRGNLVDGEYDWDSACSLSGIMGSYAAAPTLQSATPPLSTGVSISHNTIIHADGWGGGAISVQPTWYRGSPGKLRPLVQNLMIHHNQISSVSGSDAHAACGYGSAARAGIHLEGRQNLTGTSLYMNTCENVSTKLIDRGESTFSICDISSANSCECSGVR